MLHDVPEETKGVTTKVPGLHVRLGGVGRVQLCVEDCLGHWSNQMGVVNVKQRQTGPVIGADLCEV